MTFTKTVFPGALALLAATTPAWAQTSGLYVAGAAGANFRQEADLSLDGAGAEAARMLGVGSSGTLGFAGAGPVVLGSLGWGFGNGLRAELEFNYRQNDVDSVSVAGYPAHPVLSGSTSTHAVMANVHYDIPRLGWRVGVPVTPYVGLGGGYAWSAYDRVQTRSGNDGSMTYGVDGRFAYQAILGLAWDLSSVASGLSLTTEYRYFAVLDQQVEHGAKIGRASFRDAQIGVSNRNHALLLGLRYEFRSRVR